MQSMVSDELLKELNGMLGQMIGEFRGYSLNDEIRRRVDSGAAEEARLTKLALESGGAAGRIHYSVALAAWCRRLALPALIQLLAQSWPAICASNLKEKDDQEEISS